MNPELKALLDKYAAAGANDDELRQIASDWQAKNGGAPSGAQPMPQPADASQAPPQGDMFDSAARHVLNTAQGIPGFEALEAFSGMLGSHLPGNKPMSYSESLKNLRETTGEIGSKTALAEKFLGGLYAMRMLPPSIAKNPVASGALLAGSDEALNADPDESLAERGVRTAAGATAGGILGRAAGIVSSGVGSMFGKSAAATLLAKNAERAAAAKTLYAAALDEGQGKAATAAVSNFLKEPDIAEIVSDLQKTRPFQSVSASDPRMLDAVYKELSDRAIQIRKGLDAVTPNRANSRRFGIEDIDAAKQRLLNALEASGKTPPMTLDVPASKIETEPLYSRGHEVAFGPVLEGTAGRARGYSAQVALDANGQSVAVSPRDVQGPAGPAFLLHADPERMVRPGVVIETPAMRVQTAPSKPLPAMMPSYRKAVEDFAARTREMNEIQRGYGAVLSRMGGMPSVKQLMRTAPEALADNLSNAAPADALANARGILGGVKQAPGILRTLRAANAATSLLQSVPGGIGTPQGNVRAGSKALLATLQSLPPGLLPALTIMGSEKLAGRAHSLLDGFLPEP